jgi:predicted phage baseplate assembly protein
MIEAPKVDNRTATVVAHDLFARFGLDRLPEDQLKQRVDAALIQVFSRFSELVIDRLNQAPGKKFLAFLDFLGLSPLPQQAAVVPLTFVITPKASSYTVVPAGTRVSAAPAAGNQKPVIFETLAELVISGIEIDSLFVKNGHDGYADLRAALLPVSAAQQRVTVTVSEKAVSADFNPIPHIFYLAVPYNEAWKSIDRLSLQFALEDAPPASPGGRALQWEIGSGPGNLDADPGRTLQIVLPETDTTESLIKTGTVVFKSLPPMPPSVVSGIPSRWLCCRLLGPTAPEGQAGEDQGSATAGPRVRAVTVAAELARAGLRPEQAFNDKLALDVSKDFFPFGHRPRLGDAFYLGCREAFSEQTATVTMHLEITSPEAPDPAIPHLSTNHAELRWEFWDGQAWAALCGKKPESDPGAGSADPAMPIFDQTLSLSRGGKVEFTFPGVPAELSLNGIKNYWVRARIAAGDFGREVQVQVDAATGKVSTIAATLDPRSIRSLTIDYSARKETRPAIVVLDEWEAAAVVPGSPWRPFLPGSAKSAVPALYAGFKAAPAGASTANQQDTAAPNKDAAILPYLPISAYVLIDELAVKESTASNQSAAIWEYWNGAGWKRFTVVDETQGFRKSGLIQVIPPRDFVAGDEFGKGGYWLRMRLSEGRVPPIRAVLLNTTMASHALTITNDILGSSTGEPRQTFRTTYPSVLAGQTLEVCETTFPSQEERKSLHRYAGTESPISPAIDKTGKKVYWVTWREVDSLHASGPRDRHYVLDHANGEVLFGDGLSGMIPPILSGNIRMCYRTGGGLVGNQPAQAVKQLVSAIPYVQKVANWVPAIGGNDTEPMDAFVERGPREMRHLGRAVTREDFEDLALRASREVARARCLPQCDLRNDPTASWRRPGLVSVIVVPRSADAKPVPSADLLERVKTYLDARRLATAELVVVGPDYVHVGVDVSVVVNRPQDANQVEQALAMALDRYLHPIRGGPANSGWDFGRVPQRSDLYALIEKIPGVSYIGSLNITMTSERPAAGKARHLLVCSGLHTLTMSL